MNIATPESFCYVSPCGDLVLEDPVSQEIIDSSSPDHVASRIDLLYSTQHQWINGHRIPATHTKMLHLVVCMSASVVPSSYDCPRQLTRAIIVLAATSTRWTFAIRVPVTRSPRFGTRSCFTFSICNQPTSNPPLERNQAHATLCNKSTWTLVCIFLVQILIVPKPFVNFTLYWGTLPTIRFYVHAGSSM